MVFAILQAVTSLWNTQHQVHPGRTAARHRLEEGAQAEGLLTMEEADDAVTAEEGTTDETPGVLCEGIPNLQALCIQAVIDPVAERFREVLLPEGLPLCHQSAVSHLRGVLQKPSIHHQRTHAAEALQQFHTWTQTAEQVVK